MLFTTKGDGIHCRFLELLDDLTRVGRYAWGAALLAHTFADLSTGTGRETIVGGFAPFLQVWSYYYLPLGRATEVDPTAVPLARRWLPLVSMATYAFQLDVLRQHVRDFPALLVVWEPYADYGDADHQWVVSGRGLFRRDIWVHCLYEIEPLRLRLAARTLGLHQHWIDEAESKGIGRKTRGKAKTLLILNPEEHRIQVEGNLSAFDLNAEKIAGIDHVHGCAHGGKGVSQEVLVTRNMNNDKLGEQLGVGRSVFLPTGKSVSLALKLLIAIINRVIVVHYFIDAEPIINKGG
ncbi:hypothetical protein Taro_029050 [Colocasia esculenta]|uniref:Aminotransferase-like plant mobile domain-containing protein n=1 Tax=Colocasia esculenta TaxID=4460 RepID=A0A843VPZ5_COLES|nr:hypothetical protein [Colocasia esculenta]